MAIDGRWCIVGSPSEKVGDFTSAGAAYLFERSGFGWVQAKRMTADDPALAMLFGNAVAIDDDVALVGVPGLSAAGVTRRGGVRLYRRSGSANWNNETLIIAPGGAANDIFGDAVALDDSYIAIGAPRADVAGIVDAGKVYIYTRAGVYVQTLSATDPGAGDQFGDRVSISGDYLFVASPEDDASTTLTNAGSAYVFHRSGSTWSFSQKLVLPDAARDDFFGADLAVKGNQAVLACRGDDTPVLGSGAVYPYRLSGTTWVPDGPRLLASQPTQFDVFGIDVAIERDKIVVGAYGDGEGDDSIAGAIYIFERGASGWSVSSKRTASPREGSSTMGKSVAVSDGTILAGSPTRRPSGMVHSFRCEVNPVVFIPGIAGSRLVDAQGDQLWPTVDPDKILKLKLGNGVNVTAVDIARDFTPVLVSTIDLYQPLIDYFVDQGYREYQLEDDPSRLTSGHMLSLTGAEKPTFFPFPYDWRRSSADHVATLRTYIDHIRQLHPGRNVDIVAHSMGGLLTRRTILSNKDGLGRVATIGTPFWGTPVATERLLAGRFFDKTIVDFFANDEIREVLSTFPAFFELLPSDTYWNRIGPAATILSERGWDLDHNGFSEENYPKHQFWKHLDKIAGPPVPSAANSVFHTSAQDDWRTDAQPLEYFHGVGDKGPGSTVTKVIASAKANHDGTFGSKEITTEKGPGDGTVTLLSAARELLFSTPEAKTKVFDATSGNVEHMGLTQNAKVLAAVAEFIEAGTVRDDPAAAPAALGRMRVRLTGCGYARIRDAAGNENTRLSPIAALRIPDLDISYGGSAPWVDIETDAGREFTVDGAETSEPLEAEIVATGAASEPVSLRRFRLPTASPRWQVALSAGTSPVLKTDANHNGTWEPQETVAPTHDIPEGQPVDHTAPTIGLTMAIQGANAVFSFQANDAPNATPPTVRYRRGTQPLQTYTAPLAVALTDGSPIRAFAEDAAGNLSGLIETSLRPPVQVQKSAASTLLLTWNSADGYGLFESGSLTGPWQRSTAPITESGATSSTTVSISTTPPGMRFYRLQFEGLNP